MNTKETKKAGSFRLDRGLYKHIEELAKKNNHSFNNLLETLLIQATNYHEPNQTTIDAMNEIGLETISKDEFHDLVDKM
ncbi:hypothetical protein HX017_13250 [Myroides marinus]|uniref:CopG family transcriptional regulator n=1 Tax=Myroides marinus TaxID=703342 RepID=A0A161SCK0_9FLAO|nr:hypothetical protein [Myroides marinus]KUF40388.1 hypothetical protein AS361_17370 [Myroides marinus]KZE83871.1 hypothetical protein AV926_02920 [Myroides marinus]MDM1348087.1 hypothetical protein [Myroides marinus]MDM1351738.1 hypothetical protein [Myroides marinus]MDM1358904.1 hypothetical protein [Myroides marinus]